MVRQMQIAQKYDSLGPEQKQQFDQSAKSFLSSDFSDAVIVYVTYETNSQAKAMELSQSLAVSDDGFAQEHRFFAQLEGRTGAARTV